MAKLIVHIVIWSNSFEDWGVDKVFGTKEKAEEYVASLNYPSNHYIISSELE